MKLVVRSLFILSLFIPSLSFGDFIRGEIHIDRVGSFSFEDNTYAKRFRSDHILYESFGDITHDDSGRSAHIIFNELEFKINDGKWEFDLDTQFNFVGLGNYRLVLEDMRLDPSAVIGAEKELEVSVYRKEWVYDSGSTFPQERWRYYDEGIITLSIERTAREL